VIAAVRSRKRAHSSRASRSSTFSASGSQARRSAAKSSASNTRPRVGSRARIVASRSIAWLSAISPRWSPGPTDDSSSLLPSGSVTNASSRPSSTRNSRSAGAPWTATTAPASAVNGRSSPASAIASAASRSANRAVRSRLAALASRVIATTLAHGTGPPRGPATAAAPGERTSHVSLGGPLAGLRRDFRTQLLSLS